MEAMKKAVFIGIAIAIALAIGVAATFVCNTFNEEDEYLGVGEFQLSEYNVEIGMFPFDRNVGDVEDPETAIKKAKNLWQEVFEEFNSNPNDPFYVKKFEVSYDSESESWLINGTLPTYDDGCIVVGGVPYALIERDGTVLAIWHDM